MRSFITAAAAFLCSAAAALSAPPDAKKVEAKKPDPTAKADAKKADLKSDFKADGAPVKPALKFPADRTDKFTATAHTDQTLAGGALKEPVKTVVSQTIDGTMKVIESGPAGAIVEVVYERVRADMTLRKGVRISYDSQKDKPEAVNPLLMSYTALAGAKLTFRFTNDNRLETVSGMDAVLDKIAKQPGAAEFLETYRSSFGDAAAKREWAEMLTDFLPKHAVKPGETWNAEAGRDLAGIGKSALKMQFVLSGVDGAEGAKTAKIDFTGSGAVAPGGTGKVQVKVSTDSLEQTGSASFDLDRGFVTRRTVTQTGKGSIAVPMSPPMTFDQTYKSDLKITFGKDEPAMPKK